MNWEDFHRWAFVPALIWGIYDVAQGTGGLGVIAIAYALVVGINVVSQESR